MKNLRKNADAQQILEAHIPWYRRRGFWLIIFCIFGLSIIYSMYNSILYTSGIDTLTTNQIISGLISSSGGIFVSAYGYKLLGTIGAWIGLAIYYLLLIILTRKTFEHTRVKLYYPMLFIVLFIPGMVYTFGLF